MASKGSAESEATQAARAARKTISAVNIKIQNIRAKSASVLAKRDRDLGRFSLLAEFSMRGVSTNFECNQCL